MVSQLYGTNFVVLTDSPDQLALGLIKFLLNKKNTTWFLIQYLYLTNSFYIQDGLIYTNNLIKDCLNLKAY